MDQPNDATVALWAANERFDRGEFDTAASLYRRVLESDPANAAAASNLAECLAHLGRAEEAEATLTQALLRAPDSAFLHFRLGEYFSSVGKAEEAAKHFRASIALDPNGPAAQRAADLMAAPAIPVTVAETPQTAAPALPAFSGVFGILSDAFDFWLHNLHVMAIFSVVLFLLSAVPTLVVGNIPHAGPRGMIAAPLAIVVMPFFAIVQAVFHLMLMLYVDAGRRGESLTLPDLFSRTLARFPMFFITYILFIIASVFGLFLCIIPGVLVFARYYCCTYLVGIDGATVSEAFDRGPKIMERSYGIWFGVLVLIVVIYAVTFGAGAVAGSWGTPLAKQLTSQFFYSIVGILAWVVFTVMYQDFKKTAGY